MPTLPPLRARPSPFGGGPGAPPGASRGCPAPVFSFVFRFILSFDSWRPLGTTARYTAHGAPRPRPLAPSSSCGAPFAFFASFPSPEGAPPFMEPAACILPSVCLRAPFGCWGGAPAPPTGDLRGARLPFPFTFFVIPYRLFLFCIRGRSTIRRKGSPSPRSAVRSFFLLEVGLACIVGLGVRTTDV